MYVRGTITTRGTGTPLRISSGVGTGTSTTIVHLPETSASSVRLTHPHSELLCVLQDLHTCLVSGTYISSVVRLPYPYSEHENPDEHKLGIIVSIPWRARHTHTTTKRTPHGSSCLTHPHDTTAATLPPPVPPHKHTTSLAVSPQGTPATQARTQQDGSSSNRWPSLKLQCPLYVFQG